MQNPNKLSLFLAIEGYKNGDLTEDLMRTAVDAYSKSIIESNKSKELSDEALEIKFRFAIAGKCFSNIAAERASEYCVKIAKQHTNSKLEEYTKWLRQHDHLRTAPFPSLIKQFELYQASLKQQS